MSTLPKYFCVLAGLEAEFSRGLPIAMYHKVATPRGLLPPRRGALLYVSPRFFERQLRQLKAAGFRSAMPDHAFAGNDESRRIAFTFDDGFENVFDHALPLLNAHGFSGLVYLVADKLGKWNDWEQPLGAVPERLMDESQVREWLAAGHQIGAHTLTHPRLTLLSRAAAREEISASRKKLEDRFGVPVTHFCYPYGDHTDEVVALTEEAGFSTATTTKTGVNQADTPKLRLRRYMARYPKWDAGGWLRLGRAAITDAFSRAGRRSSGERL